MRRILKILLLLIGAFIGFMLLSNSAEADVMPAQPAQPVLPSQPSVAAVGAADQRVSELPVVGKLIRNLAAPKRFNEVAPTVNLDPPIQKASETTGLEAPTKLPNAGGPVLSVDSTAYCLTSGTATGHPVGPGVVAANLGDGTSWRILDGPQAGRVVTVWDHPDGNTQFDIWMASCTSALQYGRNQIHVQQVVNTG